MIDRAAASVWYGALDALSELGHRNLVEVMAMATTRKHRQTKNHYHNRKTEPKPPPNQKVKSLKKLAQQNPNQGQWIEEVKRTTIQSIKVGERSIWNAAKFYSIPASFIGN
jgi:hypothetical protein